MRPFSVHVDFKQKLSLALTHTHRQKTALTAKKHPLDWERWEQETDKRSEKRGENEAKRETDRD